ncbi:MAG: hypothetical protein COX90_01810 [Candidatus Nealsonbacteria bacterium CG_4_10_14_0_2_um_filter_38_17]|uniref:5'-deoxynucleotidase n=2 Tax=Candidatus Nealsoniibacteriota TaxID=1817911 RepID=A0A2M7UYC0_9BACT|nr:MAG: hypothetical protein COX36_04430 [Candidatus Nealsonbacteria bacterium CG23_combo_of_CG06-09_8_20_14_all_38_19]PIZ88957.1 MAG: hypothetical protein COX90_01810 [Candidatus Nealsonbacteria bacterium CG_4_10_14_0_2_um_filter_38_17]
MKNLVDFFIKVGELENIPKRGWLLIGEKNPQTIADHIFRVAIMAWVLAKERKTNFNMERVIKLALVHDLCELYAGDTTPYDYGQILPKNKKKWPELFDKWPRFPKSKKLKFSKEKHRNERKSLKRLTGKLPSSLKKEFLALWTDYECLKSKEAKFVSQINRIETLLRALEYAKKKKTQPYRSWWIGSKERVDDPLLVKFMATLDKCFPNQKIE